MLPWLPLTSGKNATGGVLVFSEISGSHDRLFELMVALFLVDAVISEDKELPCMYLANVRTPDPLWILAWSVFVFLASHGSIIYAAAHPVFQFICNHEYASFPNMTFCKVHFTCELSVSLQSCLYMCVLSVFQWDHKSEICSYLLMFFFQCMTDAPVSNLHVAQGMVNQYAICNKCCI